jgi:hypothetical protein
MNAFDLGFAYGRLNGPASPREAIGALTMNGMETDDYNVTFFCNGAEDGAKNDSFRKDGAK